MDPRHIQNYGSEAPEDGGSPARTRCQKWQATECSRSISSGAGTTSEQRACANAQRV